MSKIGRKPILISSGVEVKAVNNELEFKGKEGSLKMPVLPHIKVKLKTGEQGNEILVYSEESVKQAKANWGTMAALTKNAIRGVAEGFSKTLEIEGIGFKASMEGSKLVLHVGFSHPVKFETPAGVKIAVEKNQIKVFGVDRALVGETAANIRKIKKPEPYKGKGIRYQGEIVRRKQGKKVAGAGVAA